MEKTECAPWGATNRYGNHAETDPTQRAKRVKFVSLRMVKEQTSLLYPRNQIRCAQDAVDLARPLLEHLDRERFVVIVVDTKHRPTHIQVVSEGILDATLVHPREIYKIAIIANASGIICLHCHPSGDPTCSPEDISVTKRLCDAGKIIGIDVLDHVIFGDGAFESMRSKGLMP